MENYGLATMLVEERETKEKSEGAQFSPDFEMLSRKLMAVDQSSSPKPLLSWPITMASALTTDPFALGHP